LRHIRYPVPDSIAYDPYVIGKFVKGFKETQDQQAEDKWDSLARVCTGLYKLMPEHERTDSAGRNLETLLTSKLPAAGGNPTHHERDHLVVCSACFGARAIKDMTCNRKKGSFYHIFRSA